MKATFKGQKKAKKYWRKLNELEDDIVLFLTNMKRARFNDVPLFDESTELADLHAEGELRWEGKAET
ncbi:hypothetical protein LJC67_03230 [Bacteroidales bacterium OttesenSCG-928-A14]|nr:hypothetical protein [Bacteroidales bacterium OttesenSCG-928-A14]